MKINKLWILCLLILCSCSTKNEEDIVSRGFERAELQLSAQLKVVPEPNEYPRTIKGGKLKTTKRMIGPKGSIRDVCGMYMNIITMKTGKSLQ